MLPMQREFDKIIRGLFPEGETVLLAVSGGRDSMCMTDLFMHSHVDFVVANCNFHLRGDESDGDSEMVASWCKAKGIECISGDFDTIAYASQKGISIEMAARELRYDWFDKLCLDRGFSALAVAHNANDNAETLMLNMLRGSGIKGMTGMKTVSVLPVAGSRVKLVRPLLSFSRKMITEYVFSHSVPFREDSSNAETEFKRNKLRHLAFPIFEKINPSFLESFTRDMSNLSQVEAFALTSFEALRPNLVNFENAETLRLSVPALKSDVHLEYLLHCLLDVYGFTASDINSLSELLLHSETISGKTFFSSEWRLTTTSSEIIVSKIQPERYSSLTIGKPGVYELEGIHFSVEFCSMSSSIDLKRDPTLIIADSSALNFPFVVRNWREGDWMVPLGMHGRKKLSDMFVDLKMSILQKRKALVIEASTHTQSRVLALLGHRIDDSLKVRDNTASVVIVKILS